MNTTTNDNLLSKDKTSQKTTQNIDITELSQHKTVKVITSLDQISASLGYLAQCDYICGNNGDNLTCDAQFGRGYLLDMLSGSLGHLAKDFEQVERLYNNQQLQHEHQKTQTENLKSELEKLIHIKEKYQQLQTITDKNSDDAKSLQQQIEQLNNSL